MITSNKSIDYIYIYIYIDIYIDIDIYNISLIKSIRSKII